MIVGMRSGMRIALVLALTLAVRAAAPGELRTRNFTFHYFAIDAESIYDTARNLERGRLTVLDSLDVHDMPRVDVTFYLDHASMEDAARPIIGFVPAWAYGLVTSERAIHCMSPNLAEWGPYNRRMKDVVHEFVHTVTLHMNPDFANHPRWLWEAVSVYEAGQNADLSSIPYLMDRKPPSLAELNRLNDTRIYEVGYTIGDYIVKHWGIRALRDLIRKNGDTSAVLHVTPEEFERGWQAFLLKSAGA
ncbi:MAG TPA: hypothetical protein VFV19_17515 [Candidatus Polarisedimenticolaceae bacterium]|nr:hypothetical protein [Candidatus Polarisedimenticolaceae bacterium]